MTAILALDPATKCGWARGPGVKGLSDASGVWDLNDYAGALSTCRLNALMTLLTAAYEKPFNLLAFEEASFGAPDPTTQRFHNELRGVMKLFASQRFIRVIGYHPTSIKKFATGSGRATKDQMIRPCQMHFGFAPQDDNEADARFILEMARQGVEPPRKARRKRKDYSRQAALFAKRGRR